MYEFNAKSLQGTVVGLLFTKTGREIREAVTAKVSKLDAELERLHSATEDVAVFLEEKQMDLTKLSKFYQERRNEKEAQARPFRRQVEEIHKAWADKEFEFNRETEQLVGERAVLFEQGFEEFEQKFAEIDELAEEVDELGYDTAAPVMMAAAAPGASFSDSFGGQQVNSTRKAVRSVSANESLVTLPTEQDKAVAKLNTLQNKVYEARSKVATIDAHIRRLEQESDHLKLIRRHLKDDREYTLDLSGLASLGFENDE